MTEDERARREGETDEQWSERLMQIQQRKNAERLKLAMQAAEERGKQPFDLDALEAIYDTSTDVGYLPPRPQREKTWTTKYYVIHEDVMTIAELAERMQSLDPYR